MKREKREGKRGREKSKGEKRGRERQRKRRDGGERQKETGGEQGWWGTRGVKSIQPSLRTKIVRIKRFYINSRTIMFGL